MINLANLPTPDVLLVPSYETLVAENLAIVQQLIPDYLPLESDNTMLLIQAFAYREKFLRIQFNNKLKTLLLPYATGRDLDVIAVFYGMSRLTAELDEAFRERVLKSLDGHTTAGSEQSYEFHARSVSAVIDDVNAYSPAAGQVTVAITSFNQVIDPALLSLVSVKLNEVKVRPLTDIVSVVAANIKAVNITASLEIFNINDQGIIQANINNNFNTQLKIGQALTFSQMISYCHLDGVYKVNLTSHSADISCNPDQIIHINSVTLLFTQAL